MQTTRRDFFRGAFGTAVALGASTGAKGDDAPARGAAGGRGLSIGVSTYSFWHFTPKRVEVTDCIEWAARMGFDGVELLHQQMSGESNGYLQDLKRRAHANGLALMGFSVHQSFVSPDPEVRRRNVDHTLRCIEIAYRLGIPTMRLNTGRWGTIKSFDDFMAVKGIEPVPEGHTDD